MINIKIILRSFIILMIITFNGSFAQAKLNKNYIFHNNLFKNFYVRASSGFSFPVQIYDSSRDEMQTNLAKHNSPKLYAFALGYFIDDNFRADISVRVREKYCFSAFAANYFDASNPKNKMTDIYTMQKLRNTSFIINGYYQFNQFQHFNPYITAGLGVAINKADNYITDYTWGNNHIHSEDSGKRNTNLTFDLGVGSLFQINKNLFLDFNYKNVTLGTFKTKKSTTGKYAKIKFRLHEVSMGLIFKLL